MNAVRSALYETAECHHASVLSTQDTNVRLENYASFCHTLASLEVLSSELAHQAAQAEPYETLVRKIAVLDQNIRELAGKARQFDIYRP
ncbi:MAG: hypothetical protein ACR2P1_24905 [Pseudomonadales bacterium]